MRSRRGYIAVALFIATATVASSAAVANAATTATGGAAKAAGCGTSAVPALSPAGAAATSDLSGAPAVDGAGYKVALAKQSPCSGLPVRSTPDSSNTVIPYLAQFAQANGWYCGPATVSEISSTVPGPSPYNLDQGIVAAYMGTTQQSGTDTLSLVRGLNHFVGQPDFGRDFYVSVKMHDPATAAERGTFEHNLDTDISLRSPVAGDAWEVPYGPHLVGHPVNQEIRHWFEIGGRAGSRTYYADSATSVWSSVPPYSWYDTYTLETILGGLGYIW